MSSIVLVSPGDEFTARLVDAFGPQVEDRVVHWWNQELVTDTDLAAGKLGAGSPAAILIGPGVERDQMLGLAAALGRSHPETAVILVTEPRPDLWRDAMKAGAVDILGPDASSATVNEVVGNALGRWDKLMGSATPTGERTRMGSIVTVVEPKGGSGKTSVMANLAVVLAQRFPNEVAIVDLDLQFGDLADALYVTPRYTMSDVAKTNPLDATTLKAFLTRRNDLFVLCAPTNPAEADSVGSETIIEVLDLLAQEFTWVLVDTAGGLAEPTLTAIEHSTDLLLLSSLDVLAKKSMQKSIQILDELGIIGPRRHLVLNRADSKVGMDRTEVIMDLGMRRATEIPSDKVVPLSLNRGQPLVEMSPRAGVARRIADLAEELISTRASADEWSRR